MKRNLAALAVALTLASGLLVAASASAAPLLTTRDQVCVGTTHWSWSAYPWTINVTFSFPGCAGAVTDAGTAGVDAIPDFTGWSSTGYYFVVTQPLICGNQPEASALTLTGVSGWSGVGAIAGPTATLSTESDTETWASQHQIVFDDPGTICSPSWSATGTDVNTIEYSNP